MIWSFHYCRAAQIKSLQSSIDTLRRSARNSGDADAAERGAVLSMLQEASNTLQGFGPGGDLRRFCRPRNPALVRLLLGDKTNVVTYRQEQLLDLKNEYHRFRNAAALVMFFGPALLYTAMRHSSGSSGYSFRPQILTGE